MHDPNIKRTFALLLEELAEEIERVYVAGGAAMTAGDLAVAENALGRAKELGAVQHELNQLRDRLTDLVAKPAPTDGDESPSGQRAPDGAKTPSEAYREPILRALVKSGGSGKAGDILEAVYKRMEASLNEWDLASLPSGGNSLRWRNTAQWCAWRLRKDGLMQEGLPEGTWGISDTGRQWVDSLEQPFRQEETL